MTPEEARQLMHEWTESEALRVHMESVAACMAAYANRMNPEERDRWIVCGLLHDFDYEKHPTAAEHPFVGVKHLESIGMDRETLDAILGHAEYTGVQRESLMAQSLYAVDELAGFIVACCKVRPDGIESLAPKSVKKKLKDKSFAAAVDRASIQHGAEALGVDITEHIQTCIDAMRAEKERLGL
ncbi:HAD family hydrolase [bacterium]|nr:HAD family hydrolase [bacterium]